MYHPIRNHSHYSLLKSTSRCDQIVEKCKELGYKYAGITDILSVSGCIKFIKSCKKNDVIPIIGTDVVFDDGSKITLICKNKSAWKDLLKVISISNNEDNYTDHACITKEELFETINCDNFICIDGYVGSFLFNSIYDLSENERKEAAKDHIALFCDLFEDYYLEVDMMASEDYEDASDITDVILDSGHSKIIPSSETYYINRKDSIDHKILMCVELKTTLNKLINKIEDSNPDMMKFIMNSNYHIKKPESLSKVYQDWMLENMDDLVSKCEEFEVLSPPKLPHFKTPNGETEIQHLIDLCRSNWDRLIPFKGDKKIEYEARFQKELGVIEKANLAGYFLIVQDYVNHFAKKGVLIGPGRGCFLPDTRVKMSDGTYMPISMIECGDFIIDAYGDSKEVYNTFQYDVDEEILELEFDSNKIIRCTKDHKFLTKNRGWVEAQNLTEEDILVEV